MERSDSYVPEGRPFKYCSNCGAKIDKDAELCPKCGVRQTVARPSRGGYSADVVPPPTESDFIATQKIQIASILGMVGTIIPLLSITLLFSSLFSLSAGIVSGAIGLYVILMLAGVIVGIVSIVIYRTSFSELMNVDMKLFKTPYGLVKYFYIGLILMVVALIIFIIGIVLALSSLSSSNFFLFFVLFAIIMIIAAILLLIGLIGLVLGLWNVGKRYDNMLLKIGAILYIIPYADIVAPILVFIGAHSARSELEGGGSFNSISGQSGAVTTQTIKEDSFTRLNNLKKLLDSGQISQEDYDKKREEILREI